MKVRTPRASNRLIALTLLILLAAALVAEQARLDLHREAQAGTAYRQPIEDRRQTDHDTL